MRSPVAFARESASSSPTAVDETLEALVDRVMRQARDRAKPSDNNRPSVILDVETDGIRCVVLSTEQKKPEGPLLSPREQEIARLVARGFPNKAIAAVLEISSWTVGTYLRRMFAKLGVTSRAAMVAKVLEDEGRFKHLEAPS